MRGIDILIQVEDKDNPGTFVTVAGQRNATFSEEAETIDITNKLSPGGYQENDYGLGSWEISCDGVYVLGDAQFKALRDAQRNKELVKCRWVEIGSTEVEEGFAVITSREIEGPYDDAATYQITLTGTGKPTVVTTP
jgi:TP901-1 family phage major tail protein